jgi:hypothetical protein
MNNKFVLEHLDSNGEVLKKTECKTLRVIGELLNLEYHQVRLLYLHSRKPSKLHPFLKEVSQQIRIVDNPNLFSTLTLV